ncbi:transthyretin-like family domain-containing protein [Ditylenchus destructor]|uniref:Transthyretin-like family domain-containing protein n=1 Tax=Ditylenchus destructor TaxID=166010 RepID=A0AAD4MYB6_9BILA|nr:transthyretin-like family domain-containing protein [Ditylenchus destructor]
MISNSTLIVAILGALMVHSECLLREEQSIKVRGQLFCAISTEIPLIRRVGDDLFTAPKRYLPHILPDVFPFAGAKIKLFESELFVDDFLNETKSGVLGGFQIVGRDIETTWIDPYIVIEYSGCDYFLAPKEGCNYTRKIKLDQKSRDTYYANMIIVLGSANYYDQMNC